MGYSYSGLYRLLSWLIEEKNRYGSIEQFGNPQERITEAAHEKRTKIRQLCCHGSDDLL